VDHFLQLLHSIVAVGLLFDVLVHQKGYQQTKKGQPRRGNSVANHYPSTSWLIVDRWYFCMAASGPWVRMTCRHSAASLTMFANNSRWSA